MEKRLNEGREFNLFSPTIPVLFQNKDKIKTVVETTEKGAIVTQTSGDPAVVTALQAHAVEVSELVRDGRVAMMRQRQGGDGEDWPQLRAPRYRTFSLTRSSSLMEAARPPP